MAFARHGWLMRERCSLTAFADPELHCLEGTGLLSEPKQGQGWPTPHQEGQPRKKGPGNKWLWRKEVKEAGWRSEELVLRH